MMTAQHDISTADTADARHVCSNVDPTLGVAATVNPPTRPQNLYVVRGWRKDDRFYYHSEPHAKKQLFVLYMTGGGCNSSDDEDGTDSTPSMAVFAKGKWANLTRVSTTTLDLTKLSKIPSEEVAKLVDLFSVVTLNRED
jgi:hypothetical protein